MRLSLIEEGSRFSLWKHQREGGGVFSPFTSSRPTWGVTWIFSSSMTFLMKMGNVLAMFLIGLTFQAVHYVPNVPQTGKALEAMRLIMSFGPIVLIVISLVATFVYPITTKRYAEIRTDLEKLRKERAA